MPTPHLMPNPSAQNRPRTRAQLRHAATTPCALTLLALGALGALGVITPWAAQAACPSEAVADLRFRRAEDFYIVQAFQETRTELEPLVLERCFGDRASLQLARLFLGVSLHELGEVAEAERHLLDMLRADPNVEVGASVAPRVVLGVIDDLRKRHADELRRILQEMGQTEGLILDNFWLIIKIERRVEWLNALPFAVGVFQNEDYAWATFYASTQVVGLGMNVLGGSMIESLRSDTGRFSSDAIDAASAWRAVQITGVSVFAASYLASVIHGWVGYRAMPEVRTMMPPSDAYPEQELRGLPGSNTTSDNTSSDNTSSDNTSSDNTSSDSAGFNRASPAEPPPLIWGVAPIIGPDVGGVGVFWTL
jgi:hypothetical protein